VERFGTDALAVAGCHQACKLESLRLGGDLGDRAHEQIAEALGVPLLELFVESSAARSEGGWPREGRGSGAR
jgi:hypothetical protein